MAYRDTDPAAPATDGYQLNLPASAGLFPGLPFALWIACLRWYTVPVNKVDGPETGVSHDAPMTTLPVGAIAVAPLIGAIPTVASSSSKTLGNNKSRILPVAF